MSYARASWSIRLVLVGLHRVHKELCVLLGGRRLDAMTKVDNMLFSPTLADNVVGTLHNDLRGSEEHSRVQIALQRAREGPRN